MLVDVDLAWFGKRWFFDNGDLGFTALDNRFFTANLMARVNSDRAFFSKTNTKYVQFTRLAGGQFDTSAFVASPRHPPAPIVAPPVALKPPKRDYAIEAGVEILFGGEWGNATLHAFNDVSGTHEGYEVSADYSYRWTNGRFTLSPTVGATLQERPAQRLLLGRASRRGEHRAGAVRREGRPRLGSRPAD